MIRNLIKTAFRAILKHKVFSTINILGLAIGMCAFLLILEYVSLELGFDRFHENGKNIYRVVNDRYQNGELIQHGTITYSAVGPALKEDFNEIEDNARLVPFGQVFIEFEGERHTELEVVVADQSLLDMFSFEAAAGDLSQALIDQTALVVTKSQAAKIFGAGRSPDEVIGEVVAVSGFSDPMKITAVLEDIPVNSHLQFDLLVSYNRLVQFNSSADRSWQSSDYWHYIQLKPGTDFETINAEMDAFSERHLKGNEVTGSVEKFYLQPLFEAHLYSDFEYEIGITNSATAIWGLLATAIFIIGIAWINYINLSTARSLDRVKEVGIRKVVGASKGQLILQFLSEAFWINVIALIIALTLVQIWQGAFNSLLQVPLSLSYIFTGLFSSQMMVVILSAFFMLGVLLAGGYPAFVISSFKPANILRSSGAQTGTNTSRRLLVVFQFTASMILITASMVVFLQVEFMKSKDMGISLDQTLSIPGPSQSNFDSTFIDRISSFKSEVGRLSVVRGVTMTQRPFGNNLGRVFDVQSRFTDSDGRYMLNWFGVDHDFLELFEADIIVGENLNYGDHDYRFSALSSALLNESAVKLLGFPSSDAAVGEEITIYGKTWEIKGVVRDFNFQSLKHSVQPLVIQPLLSTNGQFYVKLNTTNISEAVPAIEDIYDDFFNESPFDYAIMDEEFNQTYRGEQQFGQVFRVFTGLGIVIACLGLFGLTSFSILKRRKEVGVRKVLGASVNHVVVLLSKESLKLILIASFIAIPVSLYATRTWLDNFAYKIPLFWWLFVLPLIGLIVIALITISSQTWRAATSNPVKALRDE